MKPTFTTQIEVRAAFWQGWPGGKPVKCTSTVRSEFAWFVDRLRKDGLITEEFAARVTLGWKP